MNIAIIGMGEVGRCYAKALHAAGYELSVCEAKPSQAALDFAYSTGNAIQPAPGAWLAGATWVLSCVTGSQALPVVEQTLPHLGQGASIADFTTASPDVKRQAARLAKEHGFRYVDTAIMGAISLNWERTPLLLSGDGADELQGLLEKAGGRIRVIENGAAGDAISLKILRSVFTKGMEALSVELLMSAEKQGVRQKLYEQLSDIDETPLRDFLDMLVRTHVVHAARRAHEVHDARQELAAQNLPSIVLPGVEERFRETAKELEKHAIGTANPTVEDALDWLLTNAART